MSSSLNRRTRFSSLPEKVVAADQDIISKPHRHHFLSKQRVFLLVLVIGLVVVTIPRIFNEPNFVLKEQEQLPKKNNDPWSHIMIESKKDLHFIILTTGKNFKDCGGCLVLAELVNTLRRMGYAVTEILRHTCPEKEIVDSILATKKHPVFVYSPRDRGCHLTYQQTNSTKYDAITHVHWILAPLLTILPKNHTQYWNPESLVFSYGPGFLENATLSNTLMVLTNPQDGDSTDISQDLFYNSNRSGVLWSIRKGHKFHNSIKYIHEHDGLNATQFERTERIAKNITQYEYFVTYDPYTYWSWIAAMSGTVSVVYPLQGKSKYEWLMSTFVGPYLQASNKTNLPGIAYGWSSSEINYARRTMHQLRPFMIEVKRWGEEITVTRFVRDCYRHSHGARSNFEGAMLVRDAYPFTDLRK